MGRESQTPQALLTISDAQGAWQVRVVPNKFPAVASTAKQVESPPAFAPLTAVEPSLGAHEVVIESPQHVGDIADFSVEEIATVLQVFRSRLQYWTKDSLMRFATVFKNVGPAAGASLEHAHSQVLALPFVPRAMAEELRGARRFFSEHQQCVYCWLVQEEIRQGIRLIAKEGPFVAFCAYAGRQPYETWIMPTAHTAHFSHLSDADTVSLALLLRQILLKLHAKLPGLSYNLLLHTAPFDRSGDYASGNSASGNCVSGNSVSGNSVSGNSAFGDSANNDHANEDPSAETYYHWHWELIPRTTALAGLEWGTGLYVNPLAPERAAAMLRNEP